jgi:hypothetical protein
LCLRTPAEELGIIDEGIAQAFNIECAILWDRIEQERETERLVAQLTALAMTGKPHIVPKVETAKFTKQFNEQSF